MNKLQMDPRLGKGAPLRFFVTARRVARPPTPWAWAIYEEGRPTPSWCSTRFYRSAEDAWTVGRAMLRRLPQSAVAAKAVAQQNPALSHDPALD